MSLTKDDVNLLRGHAEFLRMEGKTDMPAAFDRLALTIERHIAAGQQGAGDYPHEQMDAIAAERYKVLPTNAGFWPFCVKAGDGEQEIYKGHRNSCEAVARQLTGAFLDGGFAAAAMIATPQPPKPAGAVPLPASVHSLIALWRGDTRADKTVTGAEWNGFRSALTRCAAELEGALAAPIPQQPAAEGDDIAVDRFAEAMKAKMAAARAKGRGGWEGPTCNADILSRMLRDHVEKGDPRDVANFCMMLWNRGEAIQPSPTPAADAGEVTDELDSADQDVSVWELIQIAQECGAAKDQDDNNTWWTLDLRAFYALEARMRDAVSSMRYAALTPEVRHGE